MITHLQRKTIIRAHIFPDQLAIKGVWGRELKLAAQITANNCYGDIAFWEQLGLGFQLHSLAWFKTPEGAATLERSWRLWCMTEAERERFLAMERETFQNELDNALCGGIVERSREESVPVQKPKRKLSAIEWADARD